MITHDDTSFLSLTNVIHHCLAASVLLLGACDETRGDEGQDPASASLRNAVLEPLPIVVSMGLADGQSWVVTDDGRVKGWGEPYCDASGCPTPAEIESLALELAAVEVHGNGEQSVARLVDGTVFTWAMGSIGVTNPAQMELGVTEPAVQLALGEGFSCARLEGGAVICRSLPGSVAPASILDPQLSAAATDLTAGVAHACAVLHKGAVQCWGSDDSGQLGSPAAAGPTLVALSGPAQRVVAGGEHTCALLETGEVQCWGDGADGQLGHAGPGIGTVALEGPAVRLAAGARHSCAITTDGSLYCWGNDDEGQLGQGDDLGAVQRVELGGHRATAVFSGPTAWTTFAVLDDGGLRGWGDGDAGQLGQGDDLVAPGDTIMGKLPDIIIYDGDDD
jgi:hypothetical protein